MLPHQVEALADRGEHPQRQHVDLHQAERFQIVLVPLDERAVRHRRIVDRHQFLQRPFAQHKAADVLGEMAGKFEQLPDHVAQPGKLRVGGIEAGLG